MTLQIGLYNTGVEMVNGSHPNYYTCTRSHVSAFPFHIHGVITEVYFPMQQIFSIPEQGIMFILVEAAQAVGDYAGVKEIALVSTSVGRE